MAETKSLVVEVTPRGIAEARRQLDELAGSGKKAEKSAGDLAKQIAGWTSAYDMAARAGQATIAKVKELAVESVQLAAGFEKAKITWGVLVGDMTEGEKVFEKLKDFAGRTPLEFGDIEKAAQTLKGFGTETEQLIPTLQKLGDMARGDGSTLGSLALVFGQVQAQGRAMTQDLYQFVNAGVPIFNLLAESLGVSAGQIKELASQGKIGFKEINDAITKATTEGGQFAGMMETVAQTTSGKLSTAMDNWKSQLAEIGEKFLPMINAGLDAFNETSSRKASISNIQNVLAGKGDIDSAIAGLEEIIKLSKTNSTEFFFKYVGQDLAATGSTFTKVALGAKDYIAVLDKLKLKRTELNSQAVHDRYSNLASTYGKPVAALAGPVEKPAWQKMLESETKFGSYDDFVKSLLDETERLVTLAPSIGIDTAKPIMDAVSELDKVLIKMTEAGVLGPQGRMTLMETRNTLLGMVGTPGGTPGPTVTGGIPGGENELTFNKELDQLQRDVASGKRALIDLTEEEIIVKAIAAGATKEEVEALRQLFREIKAGVATLDEAKQKQEDFKQSMAAIENVFKQSAIQAGLTSIESIGAALYDSKAAGDSFADSMLNLGESILQQLPQLLFMAGVKALAIPGMEAIGLGLILGSGLAAMGNGFAKAAIADSKPHALGGAYASPSLSAYSNGIYSTPQFFGWEGAKTFARGGVFAEAGPEAIMPLGRDASGRLGVRAEGSGARFQVVVNNNAAGTEATTEERTGPDGSKQVIVTIERVVQGMVVTGKLDPLLKRGGMQPVGRKV